MLRSLLLKLHLWAGLGAGIFLLLVSGSGVILAFNQEIDRGLNPALLHCEPRGERLAVDEAIAAAQRDRAEEHPGLVRLPKRADDPYAVWMTSGQIAYVDAYGGRVLGWRHKDAGFIEVVMRLHESLCAGRIGGILVGVTAAVMFFLSLSGIVLWWPKKLRDGLVLRLRGSGRRLTFDLHRVIGFYASGILALIAGSGVLLSTGNVVWPFLDRVAHTPAPPRLPVKTLDPAAKLVPASAVLAAAEEALPGAAALTLVMPGGKNAYYAVQKRFPEDPTPGGRSRVTVDAESGAVVAVESSRAAPPVRRFRTLVRGLHSGDIYGLPTRVLAALASAWVTGLFVTGVLIWWSRRKAGKAGKVAPAAL